MKTDTNLAKLMEQARQSGTSLSIELCLYIVDEVCKSLELVHGERKVKPGEDRRPLSHPNLTPENVVITPEGLIKVMGFGAAGEDLARRDQASPETIERRVKYLSPEQVTGNKIDERAEVYAAAAMLYELLTETPLFPPERKLISMLDKIKEGSIRKPSRANSRVSGYLEQVLLRGLESNLSRRYQSASEFSFAIERVLSKFSSSHLRDDLVSILESISRLRVKTSQPSDSLGRKVEIMGVFEAVGRQPDSSNGEFASVRLQSMSERVSVFESGRPPRRGRARERVPVRRLVLLVLLLAILSVSCLENSKSSMLALRTDDLLKSEPLSSIASTLRASAGQISRFCRKKVLASIP